MLLDVLVRVRATRIITTVRPTSMCIAHNQNTNDGMLGPAVESVARAQLRMYVGCDVACLARSTIFVDFFELVLFELL